MRTIKNGICVIALSLASILVMPMTSFASSPNLQATLATKDLKHHFIGYHSGTPNWTKASQYVIAKGTNFKADAAYEWTGVKLGLGFNYSFSVATTIPANAGKYSRLGVFADYILKKETYAEYQYGQPTGATRTSTYAIRTANYIEPVYK